MDQRLVERWNIDQKLKDLAEKVDTIVDILRLRQPLGIVEPHTVTVDDKKKMIQSDTPWHSFSLYNRATSANTVYVRVNSEGAFPHPVGPDGAWELDMKAPSIEKIYVHTASGGSATIDITALR